MQERKWLADLFLTKRFFVCLAICIVMYVITFYFPLLWHVANVTLFIFCILVVIDYALLFVPKILLTGHRITGPTFSVGDENTVLINLLNKSRLHLQAEVIDELPEQFQRRDFNLQVKIASAEKKQLQFNLRPLSRGEYAFGKLWAYVNTILCLVQRRIQCDEDAVVKVYPSYVRLKNAGLLAKAYNQDVGDAKVARLASSLEFDHIKDYVRGDDIRHINWAASARRGQFMVNTYRDERSQQVYCVIDMGRIMKMPFNGLSLLDYAINSALMLSHAVMHKNDRVGLITFTQKINSFLKPTRSKIQMGRILETLYKQQTDFKESNYSALVNSIRMQAGQRSLIMLYTNYETYNSLQRHLPYLRLIADKHLLCLVVFENTELRKIHTNYKDTLEGVYIKTVADKFQYEKKLIIKELNKEGILSIFTTPEQLTTDTINKYLDLKKQRVI
jgi:uncharacterized protein (DUF58 family)